MPPLGYKCFSIRHLEDNKSSPQQWRLHTTDLNQDTQHTQDRSSPQQHRLHTTDLNQDTQHTQKTRGKESSGKQDSSSLHAEGHVSTSQEAPSPNTEDSGQTLTTPTDLKTRGKKSSGKAHSFHLQNGIFVATWVTEAGWNGCGTNSHKDSDSDTNSDSDRNSESDSDSGRLRIEGTTLVVKMPRSGSDHSDNSRGAEWSERVDIEMRIARSCADGGRCSGPYVLRSSFTNAIWVSFSCMCVYICIYKYIYMCMCVYICTYAYMFMCRWRPVFRSVCTALVVH